MKTGVTFEEKKQDFQVGFNEESDVLDVTFSENSVEEPIPVKLNVTFKEQKQSFYAAFSEQLEYIDVSFAEVERMIKYIGDLDTYDGPYSVVPKVRAQTLLTAEKRMESNVFIYSIPYSAVDNISGGVTATIGGE